MKVLRGLKFFLILSTSFPVIILSQVRCGTDAYHSQYLRQNEVAAEAWNTLNQLNISSLEIRSELDIPVVVHIVYRTEEQNLSESDILDQLDIVNVALNSSNKTHPGVPTEFKPLATAMKIRLCLSEEMPGGSNTLRITRQKTDILDLGDYRKQDIKFSTKGGVDAWDTKKYLNIWIGEVGNNILGYSTFPDMAGNPEDGIVLDVRYLLGQTPSYNLSRTLIHELGHYLGLCHLPGCLHAGCEVDDNIKDTPNQSHYYNSSECPTWPQISCNSIDMYMNYMSLAPDDCLLMFTAEQVKLARFLLSIKRNELLGRTCPDIGSTQTWSNGLKVYYSGDEGAVIISSPHAAPDEWKVQLINMAGQIMFESPISYRKRLIIERELAQGNYIVYFYGPGNNFYKKITLY